MPSEPPHPPTTTTTKSSRDLFLSVCGSFPTSHLPSAVCRPLVPCLDPSDCACKGASKSGPSRPSSEFLIGPGRGAEMGLWRRWF